ncbi:MAG: UDP-2,3-diacylglucosamine diphosphatase [Gemmatimonadales bacterium]
MLGHQLLILTHPHHGAATPQTEAAKLAFLDAVPDLGDSLLVNGDLFDFWFEYRRVIPRHGFRIAAALAALRRRVPIVMIGGNHDRWGGAFWRDDLRIDFQPLRTRFRIGTREVLAIHGDGLTEQHWSATLMFRLTSSPAIIALYRALHPSVGFWIADRMSHGLGNTTRDPAVLDLAAQRQRVWAERTLAEDPSLGLVVMGHTHRPALTEPSPGRQYLNPGAWLDGQAYAVATESGAELRKWE